MNYSASQAAKAVGKSIPTITRAIKNGKLSAEKVNGGGYKIDPSELFRVWPSVTDIGGSKTDMLGYETPSKNNVLQGEVEALRKQIKLMDEERDRERSQLSETIDDLRKRLDAESTERRTLTAQITDQREKPGASTRQGFWARLRG